MTDQLLEILISEIKGLRKDLNKSTQTTCNSKEAILIIGVKHPRVLTYFTNQGLLNRRGGGKAGYTYYKSELTALASKIQSGTIEIPTLEKIYR